MTKTVLANAFNIGKEIYVSIELASNYVGIMELCKKTPSKKHVFAIVATQTAKGITANFA